MVSQILNNAANILEENGWVQCMEAADLAGRPTGADNPLAASYCLVGALIKASLPTSLNLTWTINLKDAKTSLKSYLHAYYNFDEKSSLIEWNDEDERSKAEIIRLVREAAEYYETID